jgi:hypothetical protein
MLEKTEEIPLVAPKKEKKPPHVFLYFDEEGSGAEKAVVFLSDYVDGVRVKPYAAERVELPTDVGKEILDFVWNKTQAYLGNLHDEAAAKPEEERTALEAEILTFHKKVEAQK